MISELDERIRLEYVSDDARQPAGDTVPVWSPFPKGSDGMRWAAVKYKQGTEPVIGEASNQAETYDIKIRNGPELSTLTSHMRAVRVEQGGALLNFEGVNFEPREGFIYIKARRGVEAEL